MCFVSVSKGKRGKQGQGDTYRHVVKDYIHTADISQAQLDQIAQILKVPPATRANWKPGKFHIVHEP